MVKTALVALSLGMVLGFVIARTLVPILSTSPSISTLPPAETISADEQLLSLRAQLEAERDARLGIEYEADLLRQLLEEEEQPPLADKEVPVVSLSSVKPVAQNDKGLWFDASLLLALDLGSQEVERIQELFNQNAMDKLYLRDQATREGWLRSRRYRDAVVELKKTLLENVGTDDYDKMLYASGQRNRVEVQDTLPQSPAATAGVRRGDMIVSYAGERIFEPTTLYTNTSKGQAGEMVAVELVRDGELLTVYIPRGPLGTRFKPSKGVPVSR